MDRFNSYLHKYLNKELGPFLGFHHWIFHIAEEHVDEDEWCEISVDDHDEATVKVGLKFKKASNLLKTQCLIHELFHIPVVRIFEHVEEAIESMTELAGPHVGLARTQMAIHMKAAHRKEEQLVNKLGIILAPHAPKWKFPKE